MHRLNLIHRETSGLDGGGDWTGQVTATRQPGPKRFDASLPPLDLGVWRQAVF
jgi:hypothetical protein